MSSPDPRRSLEQIVAHVRRYPMEAFFFIQECVGLPAERVHGELTPEQTQIAKWMSDQELGPQQLAHLAQTGQLPAPIAAALESAGGPERMNRHITGQQLCHVVRDIALERWGLMAKGVLARWNICR